MCHSSGGQFWHPSGVRFGIDGAGGIANAQPPANVWQPFRLPRQAGSLQPRECLARANHCARGRRKACCARHGVWTFCGLKARHVTAWGEAHGAKLQVNIRKRELRTPRGLGRAPFNKMVQML